MGELRVSEPVQAVMMEPLRQREPPPPPPLPPHVQSSLLAHDAHIMEARPTVKDKQMDSVETSKFKIGLDYIVNQSSPSHTVQTQHCQIKELPTETLGTQVFASTLTSPTTAPRALGPIEHF